MNHMSNSDVSTKMVYENPELVFVRFENVDVVTRSNDGEWDDE